MKKSQGVLRRAISVIEELASDLKKCSTKPNGEWPDENDEMEYKSLRQLAHDLRTIKL